MAEIPSKYMVGIRGRLSFHITDIKAALADKNSGPFANKAGTDTIKDVKAYAELMLNEAQYLKVKAQLVEFLEACAKLPKGSNDALDPSDVKMLLRQIEEQEARPLNTPFKYPSEKSLELMPDCVASIKLLSKAGVSLVEEAMVRSAEELDPLDPDVLTFPKQMPINLTTHSLYNGCWVIAAPVSFYTYKNGANPGVSAQTSTVIFQRDDDPFSGGPKLDRESIFLLDEED